MKLISNKTWKVADEVKANKIREWLLSNGGEEKQTKNQYKIRGYL